MRANASYTLFKTGPECKKLKFGKDAESVVNGKEVVEDDTEGVDTLSMEQIIKNVNKTKIEMSHRKF